MQAAGLKINENQYIDWGSDIGYLKCWTSISENLSGYINIKHNVFHVIYLYAEADLPFLTHVSEFCQENSENWTEHSA